MIYLITHKNHVMVIALALMLPVKLWSQPLPCTEGILVFKLYNQHGNHVVGCKKGQYDTAPYTCDRGYYFEPNLNYCDFVNDSVFGIHFMIIKKEGTLRYKMENDSTTVTYVADSGSSGKLEFKIVHKDDTMIVKLLNLTNYNFYIDPLLFKKGMFLFNIPEDHSKIPVARKYQGYLDITDYIVEIEKKD